MEHTTQSPVPAPDWAGREHPIQGAAPFYQHAPALQEARDASDAQRSVELGDVGSQRLLEGADDGRTWPSQQVSAPASQAAQRDRPASRGEITKRVELPSGGWAELRDPKNIRAKHRKRVMDSMNPERIQAGTPGVAFDMTDGLICMMVAKWSIPYLPEAGAAPTDNPGALDDLTIPDYDTLTDHLEEARRLIFPAPPSVDDRRPGSPTAPASA